MANTDTIDIHSILVTWLKDKCYDGLAGDDCGCGVDNLAPCGSMRLECQPAYKRVCPQCADLDGCPDCEARPGGFIEHGKNKYADPHCYRPERLPPPPLPGNADLDDRFWRDSLTRAASLCPESGAQP